LIVVICVLAVLTAVGISVIVGSAANHQMSAAVERIRADFVLARQNAITTGTPQAVRFAANTSTYTLVGMTDPEHPNLPYTTRLSEPPYETTITGAVFDQDEVVVFDTFGKPDSGGTITLRAGDRQVSLTVDAETGAVSVP
jgi:Tfp pilus assembly protein FimT